jgi:hypothetical protein
VERWCDEAPLSEERQCIPDTATYPMAQPPRHDRCALRMHVLQMRGPRCRSPESCALKIRYQFDAEGFHDLAFLNNANTINDGSLDVQPVRSGVPDLESCMLILPICIDRAVHVKRKAGNQGRLRLMLCRLVYGWKRAMRRLNAVSKGRGSRSSRRQDLLQARCSRPFL